MRKQPPEAVLFDLNGTLNDMAVMCRQNQYVAWREFGLRLSEEQVRSCWGQPAEKFYPALYGIATDLPWEELRGKFQGYNHLFTRRLMPFALSTLDVLDAANIPTGIVTNSPYQAVHEFMQQTGLDPARFRLVHTNREIGQDVEVGKPTLARAKGELGVRASGVVFVGDETVTMHDAAAVGADFVVVSNGTFSSERLRQEGIPKDRLLPHLGALPSWLGLPTITENV